MRVGSAHQHDVQAVGVRGHGEHCGVHRYRWAGVVGQGASAGVSTSITTGFDVLAACPGAGGGNAITYGGGTTWFAPWTSGDQGTGGSSGLGRGGQSGTAPTGYGAGSGARKNTSSASLPGGPGYLRQLS